MLHDACEPRTRRTTWADALRNAAEEKARLAALVAEVGLPPDAPAAEITRLHKQRADDFWSAFVAISPADFAARFRALAKSVGVDLDGSPTPFPRELVWDAMRQQNHPETKQPIVQWRLNPRRELHEQRNHDRQSSSRSE